MTDHPGLVLRRNIAYVIVRVFFISIYALLIIIANYYPDSCIHNDAIKRYITWCCAVCIGSLLSCNRNKNTMARIINVFARILHILFMLIWFIYGIIIFYNNFECIFIFELKSVIVISIWIYSSIEIYHHLKNLLR